MGARNNHKGDIRPDSFSGDPRNSKKRVRRKRAVHAIENQWGWGNCSKESERWQSEKKNGEELPKKLKKRGLKKNGSTGEGDE